MRIVHVTSYFSEKVAYQENLITAGQHELGHEVHIVTSPMEFEFQFNKDNRKHECGISNYKGVTVHRIPIVKEIKNRFVFYSDLFKELEQIKPDIIFFYDHSPALFTCIKYKKRYGSHLCILLHSTKENSMNSFFGKPYHKVFWKTIISCIQKYYDKVFCGAEECAEFARDIYNIKSEKIVVLSLPGDATLLDDYEKNRENARKELGVDSETRVILHTGKFPQLKRTKEALEAVHSLNQENVAMFLIGSAEDDFASVIEGYCSKDKRIHYLGWLDSDHLRKLMVGADILLQPGSLSNTFIDGVCCGVPLVLLKSKMGEGLTKTGNGLLLDDYDPDTIKKALDYILGDRVLEDMKRKAMDIAREYDYRNVSQKMVNEAIHQ